MMPDPKWLDLLKSSGGQSAALAGASGVFLLFSKWGWVNPAGWVQDTLVFLFLLSGFLALASFVMATRKVYPADRWLVHWINTKRAQWDIEKYIPHMTDEERKIIAYLLAHNQKAFTGAIDGGHAVTLISRRIVVRTTESGQGYSPEDIPYAVPDYIWNVLVRHKDKFPYTAPPRGQTEPYPWRKHWMMR